MNRYFIKYKYITIITLFIVFISSLMSVGGAFILSDVVNSATLLDKKELAKYIYIAVFYLIVLRCVGKLDNYFQNELVDKISVSLRKDYFSAVINENRTVFHNKTVGNYMSVIINDVDIITSSYVSFLLSIVASIVAVCAAIISMIYINPLLLGFSIIIGIIYILISSSFSKKLIRYKDQWKKSLELYTNQIKDLLSGFDVIRDFSLQNKTIKMFKEDSEKLGEYKKKLCIKVENLNNANVILGQLIVFAIVFSSSYLVAVNKMTVGELIALVQLMLAMITPLQELIASINEIKSLANIKNEFINIINNKQIEANTTQQVYPEYGKKLNDICFESVSFSYDDGREILKNINLNLKIGKKYVILGESGSGKSSLVSLLLNHYQNYQGKITIDGKDYKELSSDSLAKLFAVVQQNVILFDGTIEDNITLFKNVSLEEIKEVMRIACLSKFIKQKWMHREIKENGLSLSGGEKQRISIARALLMKRKILILDEATSAIDELTSKQILSQILEVKDQTCIAIMHYLPDSVKEMFDYVYILKDGKLTLQ